MCPSFYYDCVAYSIRGVVKATIHQASRLTPGRRTSVRTTTSMKPNFFAINHSCRATYSDSAGLLGRAMTIGFCVAQSTAPRATPHGVLGQVLVAGLSIILEKNSSPVSIVSRPPQHFPRHVWHQCRWSNDRPSNNVPVGE